MLERLLKPGRDPNEEVICPCGGNVYDLVAYRFMQYRPKEFQMECKKCGRAAYGKGSQWKVMLRAYKKRWLE